jgi:nucleotide-binding universal stress UspA family protein
MLYVTIKKYLKMKNVNKLISDHGSLGTVVEIIHRQHSVDLIAAGTKGAGVLREVLIRSNTADVIKNVICPTLAIPKNAKVGVSKNIVLASDNKVFKNVETVEVLNFISQKFDSDVAIVNVKNSPLSRAPTEEVKISFSNLLKGSKLSFSSIENETIEEGINNYIEENKSDLLAMVSRKVGFFERLFNKSMTKEMATCSFVSLLAMYE